MSHIEFREQQEQLEARMDALRRRNYFYAVVILLALVWFGVTAYSLHMAFNAIIEWVYR